MTRRFSTGAVSPALAAGCVCLLWIVALVRFRGWIATDDHAAFELTLHRIGDGHLPLTGAYSRLGVRHPGPMREWIFGLVYWVSGGRSAALPATALALNAVAAGMAVTSARRASGMPAAFGAAVGVALAALGLGIELHSPWNPHLGVLAGWAALWATIAAVRHTGWVRPAAIVWASLASQLHAAAAPLGGVAIGVVGVVWWRALPVRRRWQPVALVGACWLGPLIDARHGRQSNLARLVLDADGDRIGLLDAARYLTHLLLPWSLAEGEFRTPGVAAPAMSATPLAVIVLAACGAAFAVAIRRGGTARLPAAGGLGCLAIAWASASAFVEPIYPYLFAPLFAALAIPTALLAMRLGRGMWPATVGTGLAVLITMVAAVPAITRTDPVVASPIERALRGALAGAIEPERDYAIAAYGMEVVTHAQVALEVDRLGGQPHSTIEALDLPPPPAGADVIAVAMNQPLSCLDAHVPQALARGTNAFTGKPVGVFLVTAAEFGELDAVCQLSSFRTP